MVIGIGRSFLALSAAALVGSSSLAAQGASEAFQEAKRFLYSNQDEKALEKLKEVLEANPDNSEAFELWKQTDARIWRYMLAQGGEMERIASYLLSLSKVERKKRVNDTDAINDLVEKALRGNTGERQNANLTLASSHGEFAIPALVDALGNADDDEGQNRAIVTIERIGPVATLALIPLLGSENKTLRQNVALALRYVRDNRSLPYLQRLAEQDGDAGVRAIAKKAVAEIGGATVSNSHDLFVQQANGFLAGNPMLVRDADFSEVVWSFDGSSLTAHEVPAQLLALEQAKMAAYGALEVDDKSNEGLIALTRSYLAEKTFIEGILAANPEDEAMQKVAASVQELGITSLAAGPMIVREAVQRDIQDKMIPNAVSGLGLLAQLEDPSKLAGSPLLAALGSSDKRLAYASALALSGMNAPIEASTRSMVVQVLADAVQEQAIKNIAVISSDKGLAQAFGGKQQGNWVDASTNAKDGLIRIATRGADVVVLDERIPDMHPLQAIRFLRAKTPNAKIVLIGASDKANEAFDGKVDGIVVGVENASALVGKVNEVLADVDLGANRRYATKIAEASAQALAGVDSSVYDLSSATDALSKTASREGKVGLFSLKALANGGGFDALDEVAKVLQANKDDEALAVASCKALGRIMARAGKADQGVCAVLAAIAGDRAVQASVRSAAVAALGRSPLPAAERTKLLRSLRVDPGAMGDEDGSN